MLQMQAEIPFIGLGPGIVYAYIRKHQDQTSTDSKCFGNAQVEELMLYESAV